MAAHAAPVVATNTTHVLAGIALRRDGRILVAQRPAGRELAGYWEFPGGKREPGESRREALRRELDEELGVQVLRAEPLLRFIDRRANRAMDLDFWLVTGWRGRPVPRESQAFAWLPAAQLPQQGLLPANRQLALQLWLHGCGLPSRRVVAALQPSSGVRVTARGGACVVVSGRPGGAAAQACLRRWARAQRAAGRVVLFEQRSGLSAQDVRRLGGQGLLHRSLRRGTGWAEILLQQTSCGSGEESAQGSFSGQWPLEGVQVRMRPAARTPPPGMVDLRRGRPLQIRAVSTAPAGS